MSHHGNAVTDLPQASAAVNSFPTALSPTSFLAVLYGSQVWALIQ